MSVSPFAQDTIFEMNEVLVQFRESYKRAMKEVDDTKVIEDYFGDLFLMAGAALGIVKEETLK